MPSLCCSSKMGLLRCCGSTDYGLDAAAPEDPSLEAPGPHGRICYRELTPRRGEYTEPTWPGRYMRLLNASCYLANFAKADCEGPWECSWMREAVPSPCHVSLQFKMVLCSSQHRISPGPMSFMTCARTHPPSGLGSASCFHQGKTLGLGI